MSPERDLAEASRAIDQANARSDVRTGLMIVIGSLLLSVVLYAASSGQFVAVMGVPILIGLLIALRGFVNSAKSDRSTS